MKMTKLTITLLIAIVINGCADLAEVRDFANQSAKLSAYSELTTYFRDTYKREQPYLGTDAQKIAETTDQQRQAAYNDLVELHKTVTLYMQTLATLAGEDTLDLFLSSSH